MRRNFIFLNTVVPIITAARPITTVPVPPPTLNAREYWQYTPPASATSPFDIDKVDWNTGKDISPLLKKLAEIKKKEIMAYGTYQLYADDLTDTVIGTYEMGEDRLIGVFALKSQAANIKVDLEDGEYTNLIDGSKVTVKSERMKTEGKPVILEI